MNKGRQTAGSPLARPLMNHAVKTLKKSRFCQGKDNLFDWLPLTDRPLGTNRSAKKKAKIPDKIVTQDKT
tara:strand:+ start:1024 stop:1233 length:210 start_codon:yes stop_codon:yes gene_type:complete